MLDKYVTIKLTVKDLQRYYNYFLNQKVENLMLMPIPPWNLYKNQTKIDIIRRIRNFIKNRILNNH